ncbi:MAG: NADH-quinone oxidoreductase subunit G [Polaribacter sp.]|jgi:NADH-quinone oxidoreductase subunit G
MSDSITLTINGQQIEAEAGRLLIDVADDNNIVVPRFCYHKKLSVAANCRMCLVEVERAPKPMPACATHVADGMVVHTRSSKAIAAQKSTMEFLLINHPLDCPICDQGGECELQDVAMGFGAGVSRYTEQKRVVMDKNIGPLIATDLTRCIHCTRCVRFGEEIAGLPEMGLTGRGENVEIGTFIGKAVSSELSGNVIDICPVGALTAKPSRYAARPWELTQHPTVAAHDCIGSNLYVHTRNNKVIRVVPRDNESINESWISDRDRFSYTGIGSESRIQLPMLRQNGQLKEVDWETAINVATEKLSSAANQGGNQIAALVSPQSTLEEQFLVQKLLRGLGSNNLDYRLNQSDFSTQDKAPIMPWLGRSLESIESLDACLLVAGNLRLEQPILAHRLRKATINNGAIISSVSHLNGQYNFPLEHDLAGSADQLVTDLAAILVALVGEAGPTSELSTHIQDIILDCKASKQHKEIAKSLSKAKDTAVIVGIQVLSNPHLSLIQELCEAISKLSVATLGYLSLSANSAGASLAGVLPHRGIAGSNIDSIGQNTGEILSSQHQVLLTFGVNPALETNIPEVDQQLSRNNDFIIAIDSFSSNFVLEKADLVLPLACFTETSGTFVNVEGLWQSFKGCTQTEGGIRQGWKILTALGQLLVPGAFEYSDSISVRNEVKEACREISLNNLCGIQSIDTKLPIKSRSLQKVGAMPIYASDSLVREAQPLQKTPLTSQQTVAAMNQTQADKFKLTGAEHVQVKQGQGTATLPLRIDENVPAGCVFIPTGIDAVKNLTGAYGMVELEIVR